MSLAQTLTAQLEALTTDQPMTPAVEGQARRPALPLKHHHVEAYTEELRRLGDVAAGTPRDLDGQRWQESMGGDRALAKRRVRELRKILDTQAPKKITGPRANEVYALCQRLRDEVFQPAMLPAAVARRAPSGAVGHIQRTEFTPTWNRAAVAFKRAIRALDPENPDPDLANLERFRPSGEGLNGAATFDTSAVIPGNFAFGARAKANWPLGEPTVTTPLAQAQAREEPVPVAADAGPTRADRGTRPTGASRAKRPASPAQLAALAKARERRAATREAQEG